MASFAYVAVDRTGRRTTGTLPADSRAAAMDAVLNQGLSPVSVEETGGARQAFDASAAAGKKLPAKAVEAFTRDLANLLAGGLSLSRALSLLRRETASPAAKHAWGKIHDDVVGGEPLSDAMAKFPKSFSTVYVAMVRAGEAGGFVHVVLQQIAEFRQREKDLLGKVKAAMVYPIALAVVMTGVMIFLLTFFIPKFSTIFEQFGEGLPLLTRIVVGISGFLLQYGIVIATAIGGGVFALRKWIETENGRRALEKFLLRTPLLGTLIARFALVRFARMLGTLVGAGVPLVTSLKVAREALGNQTLADTVHHAIEQVQRGTPLSKALTINPLLFPPSVTETISVAEETGRLDQELVRLAGAYEADLDRNLRLVVAVVEPLMLLIAAAVIGTVVVSMLLPVFNLQDMIQ